MHFVMHYEYYKHTHILIYMHHALSHLLRFLRAEEWSQSFNGLLTAGRVKLKNQMIIRVS